MGVVEAFATVGGVTGTVVVLGLVSGRSTRVVGGVAAAAVEIGDAGSTVIVEDEVVWVVGDATAIRTGTTVDEDVPDAGELTP